MKREVTFNSLSEQLQHQTYPHLLAGVRTADKLQFSLPAAPRSELNVSYLSLQVQPEHSDAEGAGGRH